MMKIDQFQVLIETKIFQQEIENPIGYRVYPDSFQDVLHGKEKDIMQPVGVTMMSIGTLNFDCRSPVEGEDVRG